MKAKRACIYIVYIKGTQEEINKSHGQLSLFQRKQEGKKHTPNPVDTSSSEEDFLSFFSLNESPYE
jgi:hypothetical protein